MRTTTRTSRTLAMAVAMACIGVASPATAQDRGLLDDKFIVSLGTFLLGTNTEIGVNGSAGQAGTVVDLNRDLGLEDSDRFRLDGTWRFAKRHGLRFMYFQNQSDGSRTLDRTVTIGDTTFPVNALVAAEVEQTVLELAYEYAFVQRDDYEILGTVGAHAIEFKFGVEGSGTVAGQPLQGTAETADTTAPLPVFGLRGIYRVTDKLYLEGQGQWFSIQFDNYDGSLTDLRVGAIYMFTEHFGLGAGWNRFKTSLDVSKNSFDGSWDWRYSGAQIYVTGAF